MGKQQTWLEVKRGEATGEHVRMFRTYTKKTRNAARRDRQAANMARGK